MSCTLPIPCLVARPTGVRYDDIIQAVLSNALACHCGALLRVLQQDEDAAQQLASLRRISSQLHGVMPGDEQVKGGLGGLWGRLAAWRVHCARQSCTRAGARPACLGGFGGCWAALPTVQYRVGAWMVPPCMQPAQQHLQAWQTLSMTADE